MKNSFCCDIWVSLLSRSERSTPSTRFILFHHSTETHYCFNNESTHQHFIHATMILDDYEHLRQTELDGELVLWWYMSFLAFAKWRTINNITSLSIVLSEHRDTPLLPQVNLHMSSWSVQQWSWVIMNIFDSKNLKRNSFSRDIWVSLLSRSDERSTPSIRLILFHQSTETHLCLYTESTH